MWGWAPWHRRRDGSSTIPVMLGRRLWFRVTGIAGVAQLLGCRPSSAPKKKEHAVSPPLVPVSNDDTASDDQALSLVGSEVSAYCEAHSVPESETMRAIAEETRAKVDAWVMMVGPLNAALLRLLVQVSAAKRVLELGTFTGYSAIAMAEGMPADGELITCDISEEWTAIARRHWTKSPHGKKITLKLAPALETLDALEGLFDLAFVDADKPNYIAYWDRIVPLLRPGGLLVVDNVLWGGSVVDPDNARGKTMAAFNDHATADTRMQSLMLPVRDGVTIASKLS